MTNTQQVAERLVRLCSSGKFDEATSLYAPDIVSVEATAPPGQPREAKGIDAVKAKEQDWNRNHQVHSAKVEGPVVAGPYFSVGFKMDFTDKQQNKRMQMEEVALYKVADGKIVREEFFYPA